MSLTALVGAQVFDGARLQTGQAVLIEDLQPRALPIGMLPAQCHKVELAGGVLMPGFVDLQVNGGGGVMFGDAPSLDTLRRIAAAHYDLGTRGFLPTLITDTPEVTARAIEAVKAACAEGVPGVLGLHLEGPHLDPKRKGAHDAGLIRAMTEADLDIYLDAAAGLPTLKITVAPEGVTEAQITRMSEAGVLVSLGHSDAGYETARRAFAAGARCTTHLFNAMSPLESRAPGMVGATLESGAAAGLIADGHHVHPGTIRAALAAKRGPGEIFLVTDAMAAAGADIDGFTLNGRCVHRSDGRLTLEDGTLAGADLTMARALQVMVEDVGDPLDRALQRATSIPAGLLRDADNKGSWPARLDDLIYLSDSYQVTAAADLI